MNGHGEGPAQARGAGRQPGAPRDIAPPVDVMAVLAGMQDQLDDLVATMERQQETIDRQQRAIEDLVARPVRRGGQHSAAWTRPDRAPGGA